MPVNCAIVGKQSEDLAGGFPFGSPDPERYRIRRKLHPIRQQLGGKEFSLNGTPNRPELEQGSESNTAPDPHRCPHRHFQNSSPDISSLRSMPHHQGASCAIF
jgi:hypothetical protein